MSKNNKEIKNYYGNDRLNKGYKNLEEENLEEKAIVNVNPMAKKYEYLLPPIEVISAYEEFSPGILDKIIKLAEREQEQKFLIEKANIASYERSRRMGSLLGIATAAIICTATVQLADKDLVSALIFAFIAFGAVFAMSLISFVRRFTTDRHRNYYRPKNDNQSDAYTDNNRHKMRPNNRNPNNPSNNPNNNKRRRI